MKSPIGLLQIFCSDTKLIQISFVKKINEVARENEITEITKIQLEEYFQKKRSQFTIPLDLRGTPFQIKVWNEISKVRLGKTESYGVIAVKIKNSKASRAIGMANNKNPIPIIIPCHRIIGKNGNLTGYAGGLKIKKWLIEHESNFF